MSMRSTVTRGMIVLEEHRLDKVDVEGTVERTGPQRDPSQS